MESALSRVIWLVVLIVGLPILAETAYTPSLPDIAHTLSTQIPMVEYTLTIYLVGFSAGTFIWGYISDHVGRKPCVIVGLSIFILGCICCYLSYSIEMLMMSRLIQALGGSVGSVMGQSMCRDSFSGPLLGKTYATIATSLAIFPAVGPVVGGIIAEHTGWHNTFLFLVICAASITIMSVFLLPETHKKENRQHVSIFSVINTLYKDPKPMGCALLVGGCLGISFSYFAEGPFYLIKILGLSPSQYGISFLCIALSTMLGGITSNKLQDKHRSKKIIKYGLCIVIGSTTIFSCSVLSHCFIGAFSNNLMICIVIISQMCTSFGASLVNSNSLAIALNEYKWCIGTATSLFGFSYYACVALATLIMASLHNATLLPMPLYFFFISIAISLVYRTMVLKKS